jgi:hypothetical protein
MNAVLIYDKEFKKIQKQDLSIGSIIVCHDVDKKVYQGQDVNEISWIALTYHGNNSIDQRGYFYEKEDAVIFAEHLKI